MTPNVRRKSYLSACALLCSAAFMLAGAPARAQSFTSVPLVLQDFSDCQNGNVTDPNGLLTKGTAWIVKNSDGSLNIKVGFTWCRTPPITSS